MQKSGKKFPKVFFDNNKTYQLHYYHLEANKAEFKIDQIQKAEAKRTRSQFLGPTYFGFPRWPKRGL